MSDDDAGRRGGAPIPPSWPMGPAGTASPANWPADWPAGWSGSWPANWNAATWNDCLADPNRLADSIAANPMLRGLDRMWNANPFRQIVPVDWAEVAWALRTIGLRHLQHPGRAFAAAAALQADLWRAASDVWTETARRVFLGPAEQNPAPADKRFAAAAWQANPAYRMLRDAYLLASDWLLRHAEQEEMEPRQRQRLIFHLRQFTDATSPALLFASNPAAIQRALETGGASLVDGTRNLMEDLAAGRLSMVDETAFAPGRNLALSPGKVVLRNALCELIQYAPTTPQVHAKPLLILPPWINKYYILDLQPKNSLIRHLVAQGFTVFVVSWKNPDAAMEGLGFEDYMRLGVLETSDAAREIAGSRTLNVMGYCIGGTLLAMTLAWLAKRQDKRFDAATFIVSLQDFSRVGDSAVFMGEPEVELIEQQMMARGYLDAREMSNMFNLLRANDLIWSNVVNNYLLGQRPAAFDLLYWNADGTRMTRAAHSWYLRNTYVENRLVQPGGVELAGERLDLKDIRIPLYAVGAEKDHIVPWDAAWQVTRLAGGEVRYVLANSGHIAGIINPPGGKGYYFVTPDGAAATTPEEWKQGAQRHEGSWWGDWTGWLAARSGPKGKPPPLGNRKHPALVDAPGTYVLER
ncbi:PHA/PHB synthase family protein [Falsiroseomonas oryzae]|uniref:PHA/PHB synthase family protein n=1 Tax=Falsiroseomonas oryzae TaxID=2766473 RepID=UPI0022EAB401|nr:class I poly(R)-hydroxyalkanoic acid synthase [Roseomonas sp. MO-31]